MKWYEALIKKREDNKKKLQDVKRRHNRWNETQVGIATNGNRSSHDRAFLLEYIDDLEDQLYWARLDARDDF